MHPDIFKAFKVNVKRCYKFRGMYICETDQGTKTIRISKYTPVQVTMEYNIKEHLRNNGFTCLDQLYLSDKNTPYVIYHNRVYVMTDSNNGRGVDFYKKDDIKKSVQLLSELHIGGKGFNNVPKDMNLIEIKNLGDTYDKRYRETIQLRKRIESVGSKTDFEVLYLKNSRVYQEFQEQSKEFINLESYDKLIAVAEKNKDIAHRKYTYHNIIKTDQESIVITGFEKSGYDVQLTDLVYITRRIMQRNQWDINLLLSIIEEYNKINPLSLDEWTNLKGMILFPERFAKLCKKYYHSKRRCNYNMFQRKFTKILDYKDDYVKCANEVMKW